MSGGSKRRRRAEPDLARTFCELRSSLERPIAEGTPLEILEAAEALISHEGVTSFSMRAIANRVGISLASLQYHYPTRAELIRSFFQFKVMSYAERVLQQLEGASGDAEAALRGTIRFLMEDALDDATGALYSQLGALAAHDPEAKASLEIHMQLYVRFIGVLIARCNPVLSPTRVTQRATAVVAMIEGLPAAVSGSANAASERRRLKDAAAELAIDLASR